MKNDLFIQERLAEIKVLDEQIWERRCSPDVVATFLAGLAGTTGLDLDQRSRQKALRCGAFLASRFHYFGAWEIRHLIRSVFRNLYIPRCQRSCSGSVEKLGEMVNRTRFLGLGGPAKSGAYLLYMFRQENRLREELFPSLSEMFVCSDGKITRGEEDVDAIVFVDDFSGTGTTALRSVKKREHFLEVYKSGGNREIHLYFLAATTRALDKIRKNTLIDSVECVLELDDSYRALEQGSRYFRSHSLSLDFSVNDASLLFERAARSAKCVEPMGFGGCQLLIGFHHNTPNNTLPAFWSDSAGWSPLFCRSPRPVWG
jgi:hypothetical protein